jgi:phospholipid-binding lipoprotein MlaA
MSNKQLITALVLCISLSSTIATAKTTTINQPGVDSSVAIDLRSAQDDTTSNTGNIDQTDGKSTLINRSINKIGEISNESVEQIGALGSKMSVNASASQPASVKDPFEHFNRKIYSFNMVLDKNLLLPVARVYKKVIPTPVQHGVTQFFRNLATPWTAVNNLLQGHPGTSIESLSRFVINTTTTLGFYDLAGALGVARSDQDFGQTLGVWGIGSGPYVMLPLFGPSTVRDTLAKVVDQYGAPQSYLNNTWESLGITGLKYVNLRARVIGLENFVQGDPYSLLRDIYLQDRQFKSVDANTSKTATTPDSFGEDGFGDSDFGQQKSQSIESPVSSNLAISSQPASEQVQTTPDSSVEITADTPMDVSAAVTLTPSTHI